MNTKVLTALAANHTFDSFNVKILQNSTKINTSMDFLPMSYSTITLTHFFHSDTSHRLDYLPNLASKYVNFDK